MNTGASRPTQRRNTSARRHAIGSTAAALVVVAIILVAALGITLLASQPASVSTTSSSTITSATPSSSSSTGYATTTSPPASTTVAKGAAPSISSVLVANVTIRGYPGEIGVNPNTDRIYVSDLFANELTVVYASNHSLIDTITLPGTVEFGIAVDTRSNTVFVPVAGCTNEVNATNSCDSNGTGSQKGGIVEIDGNTDSIIGEIPINVERLAIDPNTGLLYGVNGNLNFGSNSSGSLLAIDESSGSLVSNTSLGAEPLSVAVNAESNTVYVAGCRQISLVCVGAEVLIVNGTSHGLQAMVPLDFDALNFNLVVNPTTDSIYTMGLGGANLTLVSVDGTSGLIRYSAAIGSSCAGAGGGTLAIDTASDLIYASFDSQSFFLVINASTGRTVNMLSTPGGFQYAVFNSNASQVYVDSEAQNENAGYLLMIPGVLNESYANSSLLQLGTCLP